MKTAYFAGGCFWCITPTFKETEGVVEVTSGYCGGDEIKRHGSNQILVYPQAAHHLKSAYCRKKCSSNGQNPGMREKQNRQ